MRGVIRCGLLVGGLSLLGAGPAWGQLSELSANRAFAGGGLGLAVPVGEFENYVGVGGGFGGFFLYNFAPAGLLGLRADFAYVVYASETRRRPLSPTVPFIDVDVTTRNQIVWLDLGPQLTFQTRFVRPYANATIGFSYFSTSSSVRGSGSSEDFAQTTNFDDLTFAWQTGTGLWITLSRGARPVLLDASVRYVGNGRVRYLREGSIEENADGTISFEPIESETNLMWIQVGVSIGVS